MSGTCFGYRASVAIPCGRLRRVDMIAGREGSVVLLGGKEFMLPKARMLGRPLSRTKFWKGPMNG